MVPGPTRAAGRKRRLPRAAAAVLGHRAMLRAPGRWSWATCCRCLLAAGSIESALCAGPR